MNIHLQSKQWIGSFEICLCLDSLLNVSSKIIYCNSGSEVLSKVPDFVNHFKTQQTPIMIGTHPQAQLI